MYGRLVCALVLLSAFGWSGVSAAAAVDLTDVRDRIAAALQSVPASDPTYKQYQKLSTALAKADRPGLPDDLGNLALVVRALDTKLSTDDALRSATDAALISAATGVAEESSTSGVAAADVPTTATRNRTTALVRRGRGYVAQAVSKLAAQEPFDACQLWRRASKTFNAASTAANRALVSATRKKPSWQVVLRDRPAELLSVWIAPGTPPQVYSVGAADADGPTFLHGGPEGFVRIPIASTADLWWVAGVPGAGVWAVGSNGLVVQYDPTTGIVTDRTPPLSSATTFYGVWGSGPTDIWIVGGGNQGGVVQRWNGSSWQFSPIPADVPVDVLYKIAGRAPNDIYACGTGGTIVHYDGESWSGVVSGTSSTLLTIAIGGADGTSVAAVGEILSSQIVERRSSGEFAKVLVPPVRSLAGIFLPQTGDAWSVGYYATVLRRVKGRWTAQTDVPVTAEDDAHLHAVAVDDEGGVWIVGGDVFAGGKGVMLYRGARAIAANAGLILPQARWAQTIVPLLTTNCAIAACHVPPFPGGSLDMSTFASMSTAFAGVASTESSLLRVLPGRPSGSYLWHKLQGTFVSVGGTGTSMPQGDTLTATEIDQLHAWIIEGSPIDSLP